MFLMLTWTIYKYIFGLLPQIILHSRPTLRMPVITKEKNVHALSWKQYDTCELQKSDLILSSRNNRRAMNKSIGGRHLVHIYSVI